MSTGAGASSSPSPKKPKGDVLSLHVRRTKCGDLEFRGVAAGLGDIAEIITAALARHIPSPSVPPAPGFTQRSERHACELLTAIEWGELLVAAGHTASLDSAKHGVHAHSIPVRTERGWHGQITKLYKFESLPSHHRRSLERLRTARGGASFTELLDRTPGSRPAKAGSARTATDRHPPKNRRYAAAVARNLPAPIAPPHTPNSEGIADDELRAKDWAALLVMAGHTASAGNASHAIHSHCKPLRTERVKCGRIVKIYRFKALREHHRRSLERLRAERHAATFAEMLPRAAGTVSAKAESQHPAAIHAAENSPRRKPRPPSRAACARAAASRRKHDKPAITP
jgi:hypothetical protein